MMTEDDIKTLREKYKVRNIRIDDGQKLRAEIEEARVSADPVFDVDPGKFAAAIGHEYSVEWVEEHGLNAAVAEKLCDLACTCCSQTLECPDMADCFTIQAIHASLGSAYYNSPTVAELAPGRENEFPAIAKVCAAALAGGPEDPTAEPKADGRELPCPRSPGDEDIAELGLNECRACAGCYRYIGEDGRPTAKARVVFGLEDPTAEPAHDALQTPGLDTPETATASVGPEDPTAEPDPDDPTAEPGEVIL